MSQHDNNITHDRVLLGRNVRLLRGHAVTFNLLFIIPVLVPFYKELGLGFREFLIGEAVFSAIVILGEMPSGYLSDVWRRRSVIFLASFIELVGWAMLLFADSFAMAVAAQGIIGISVSLLSGTNSALLYDSLYALNRTEEFRRQEGRRMAMGLYTVAASSVLGGFLFQWDVQLPVFLTMLACVAGMLIALRLHEPERHRRVAERNPFADMVRTVRYAVHGHPEIAGIIILSSVLFAGTKMMMWSQQPYYILLGLPEAVFGILIAVGFALGGMGGHFGHLLDGRFSNIGILLLFVAVMVAICLVAGLVPGLHVVPLLLAGSLLFGFGMPRMQDAINRRVDGSRRATILSAGSLSVHLTSIPLFVLLGWVDERAGVTAALLALGGALTAGAVVGLLLIRHINVKRKKAA